MDSSIVSTEQRVSELSSALLNATALLKPLKLESTAYSDFTVEEGFSSATNSAVTMNDLVRQIGVHVDSLLNSAAAMFVDTDSAIATTVLEEL